MLLYFIIKYYYLGGIELITLVFTLVLGLQNIDTASPIFILISHPNSVYPPPLHGLLFPEPLFPISHMFCSPTSSYLFHHMCSRSSSLPVSSSSLPSALLWFTLLLSSPLVCSTLLFGLLPFLLFMWLCCYNYKTDFEQPHHNILIFQVKHGILTLSI